MSPVFCCGFECGVVTINTSASGEHWNYVSGNHVPTFSTSIVRSGNRSIRHNPSAQTVFTRNSTAISFGSTVVMRGYIYFSTLPSVSCYIFSGRTAASVHHGAYFNASDNKIYAATNNAGTVGSVGITVTTGTWYRIDVRMISSNTVDVRVNGNSCESTSAGSFLINDIGTYATSSVTGDWYLDDIVASLTSADFPIGNSKILPYVPTSDGTHNVAGADDFERSETGTDITNATTTAYQLIDDVPLKNGTPTEYIKLTAPPNSTDYVEVIFGPAPGVPTPTVAPRTVEAIVAIAASGTATNNLRIALNDNGSLNDIRTGTVGSTTCIYSRAHYADPPSAASAWSLISGNGNFNNVRMRCFTSDANPDPFWASAMIEAEFEQINEIPNKIVQVKQSINRSNTY